MKRFCWIFVALVAVVVVVACNRDKTESVKTQLDKLVTDAVINSAIESLAEDNYYVETEGATWTVCMKARHAVFQAKLGKDWFNKLYASLAAANENDHTYNLYVYVWIMKTARDGLDTPKELKAAYAHHKGTALEAVRKNGIEKKVRDLIVVVFPYFDGGVPVNETALIEAYHNASSWSAREGLYEALKLHGLDIGDVRAWEFVERRRAEGGDALVAAWAEVMNDFAESLAEPKPPAVPLIGG